MMYKHLSDIAILNIKGSNYCCIISGIGKSEAIKLMQLSIWPGKTEHYKHLLARTKMGKDISMLAAIRLLFF